MKGLIRQEEWKLYIVSFIAYAKQKVDGCGGVRERAGGIGWLQPEDKAKNDVDCP